jgi:DNA ligase (NAD+)
VEDIACYVGRTGVLTPVAHVKPVVVGGVTIRNVTMHNEAQVNEKGVYVGAHVVIHRAGDVIPEIVSVKDPKPGWKMPATCPVCGGEVVREEPYIAHRCINPFCAAQRLERLRHFASRGAMNIEGLGYATLGQVIDKGAVEDPSDLYRLSKEQVMELDGFADKSAQNLLDRIAESRRPPLGRFLYGLGIPQVGEATAELLAAEFGSVEKLHAATEDDLKKVEGVGPSLAHEVHVYFQGHGGELVEKLLAVGLEPQAAEAPGEGPLTGKTFVFTGTLEGMSRPDAEAMVRKLGGKAVSSVSARTDYVVAGPGAGSKLERAQKLKVTILDEQQFLTLVNK